MFRCHLKDDICCGKDNAADSVDIFAGVYAASHDETQRNEFLSGVAVGMRELCQQQETTPALQPFKTKVSWIRYESGSLRDKDNKLPSVNKLVAMTSCRINSLRWRPECPRVVPVCSLNSTLS